MAANATTASFAKIERMLKSSLTCDELRPRTRATPHDSGRDDSAATT
jgi:hypothetical protein